MAKTKTIANKSKDDISSRKRKLTRHEKKKVVQQTSKLPNSFVILGRTFRHLWANKFLYLGIFAIYLLLYVVFVKGLAANFQLTDTKALLDETFNGELGAVDTATTLFGTLLDGAATTSGEAASVYQLILYVIFSLVIIWSLRSTYEGGERVTLKQAFYKSSYPLVQYVLIGAVIILQAVPALLGITLFGIIVSNGIAVAAWEQIMWFMVMVLGIGATVYLLSSSLFAGYIVTLPNVTPLNALRSARKLVKYRRFSIIRKVLFLPFAMLIIVAAIFLPLVLLLPLVAEILFMLLSLAMVFVIHAYFYTLYRELL